MNKGEEAERVCMYVCEVVWTGGGKGSLLKSPLPIPVFLYKEYG